MTLADFPDGVSAQHVVILSALWLPKWDSIVLHDSGIRLIDSLKLCCFSGCRFVVFACFRRNLIRNFKKDERMRQLERLYLE